MAYVEVDQKTDCDATQSHVGQQLRFVDGMNGFHALHFDNDPVLDYEIHPLAEFNRLATIDHWQAHLAEDT